jgi:hypothetical protein
MNITYVTALYNIYKGTTTTDRLTRDVQDLLRQKLNLIIFVDEFYAEIIKTTDNIKVIVLPIEELYIYNLILTNKSSLKLPPIRNQEKDTHEYIALMNTKTEFLHRAQTLSQTDYLAWIDAGVSKMFKHKEESFTRLTNLKLTKLQTILMPGCYHYHLDFDQLCNNVWWVYLGTFFICKKSHINDFHTQCLQLITKFINKNHITWEVNIWVLLDNTINWYYSDHNDGLTILPPEYLHPHTQPQP